MSKIGWLVPTSGFEEFELDRRMAQANQHLPNDIRLGLLVPDGSPEFLDRARDFGSAGESAIELVRLLDPDEYPVVILAGAIDPGLDELRSATEATVIGPGSCCLFLARSAGARVSIITVDEHAVSAANALAARLEWAPVASVRDIGMPVREVSSSADAAAAAREAVLRAAFSAVTNDGADAIQLGAMTLSTLTVTDRIRSEVGVPVFDPLPISIAFAVEALNGRNNPLLNGASR